MPSYEVELRRESHSEFRLTDIPLEVGTETLIDNRPWWVDHVDMPVNELGTTLRFVCVELPRRPPEARNLPTG
jgi:hypothetical protein